MAIQHRHRLIVGLQFHPESILTEAGYLLLAIFLRLSGLAVAGTGAVDGRRIAAGGGCWSGSAERADYVLTGIAKPQAAASYSRSGIRENSEAPPSADRILTNSGTLESINDS